VDRRAYRSVRERPVEDRGERGAQPAGEAGSRDRLVPKWDASLLPHRGPGPRVDLSDLHALRADLRADTAAGAVIKRGIGRVSVGSEPFGLWPNVFGAGKQGRGVREGAERLADGALHAVVQRLADRLHQPAASKIGAAAR